MEAVMGSHWSAHRWTLLACVRGPRGEMDYAYLNQDGQFTLLVRRCPSVTERRLTQTRAIFRGGDFTWVVLAPDKTCANLETDDIEVLDAATLRIRTPRLKFH
jgi:hypothetical protein